MRGMRGDVARCIDTADGVQTRIRKSDRGAWRIREAARLLDNFTDTLKIFEKRDSFADTLRNIQSGQTGFPHFFVPIFSYWCVVTFLSFRLLLKCVLSLLSYLCLYFVSSPHVAPHGISSPYSSFSQSFFNSKYALLFFLNLYITVLYSLLYYSHYFRLLKVIYFRFFYFSTFTREFHISIARLCVFLYHVSLLQKIFLFTSYTNSFALFQ